jgi:hypothetical protein
MTGSDPAAPGSLCIAQDHETSALHSSGLDKCRKSTVIMGLRYEKSGDHGRQLCKPMPAT